MGLTPRHPDEPDVARWLRETRNGEIPLVDLERIEPIFFDTDLNGAAMMYPPAARAATDMFAAARRAGHLMRVRYSYRTLAVQRLKYVNYLGPDGKEGTADDGNLAADPGTSNHGNATALDLTDLSSGDVDWLVRHAWEFKFDNGDIRTNEEPWHWTYRGGYTSQGEVDDEMFEEWHKGWDKHEEGREFNEEWTPGVKQGWRDRERVIRDARRQGTEPEGGSGQR